MNDDQLLALLADTAEAVDAALGGLDDWGLAGTRFDQYRSDVVADAAAHEVLGRAGVGVLSEESGLSRPDEEIIVVIDPVDGSTNASRAIPWFATSLCAVDAHGPVAALVMNLATKDCFDATRGGGARLNGEPIHSGDCTELGASIIGLSGHPERHLGSMQFRAFGAAALDLCAVASGMIDGYVDCSGDAHGVWDYLGALLICHEAGAVVRDLHGRDLVILDHAARRTPVGAATPALCDALISARQAF